MVVRGTAPRYASCRVDDLWPRLILAIIGCGFASGPYTLLRVPADVDRREVEDRWAKRSEGTPEETRQQWLADAASRSPSTAGEALRNLARLRTDRDAFQAVEKAMVTSPDGNLRYLAAQELVHFRRYFDVRQSFNRAKAGGDRGLATYIARLRAARATSGRRGP